MQSGNRSTVDEAREARFGSLESITWAAFEGLICDENGGGKVHNCCLLPFLGAFAFRAYRLTPQVSPQHSFRIQQVIVNSALLVV